MIIRSLGFTCEICIAPFRFRNNNEKLWDLKSLGTRTGLDSSQWRRAEVTAQGGGRRVLRCDRMALLRYSAEYGR